MHDSAEVVDDVGDRSNVVLGLIREQALLDLLWKSETIANRLLCSGLVRTATSWLSAGRWVGSKPSDLGRHGLDLCFKAGLSKSRFINDCRLRSSGRSSRRSRW